jgi:hypothetical protein
MKVLFLDVDGVLNTRPGSLDEDKLSLLREIVDQTGCEICVSSSWRTVEYMMRKLVAALLNWGIPRYFVTPELKETPLAWGFQMARPRNEEIFAWLHTRRETVETYCILDDTKAADTGEGRFVQTDESVGITPEKAKEVVRILNSPFSLS